MPRKAKKPVIHQKTKNIIQNVVVKLDGEVKRKRKARKPRKKVSERESIMIQPVISPNVIYQTGSPYIPPPSQTLPPTTPIPPVPPKPPTPPTPPPPIIPPQFNRPAVARFTQTEQPSILEDIETYVSQPIEIKTKKERTEEFITPVSTRYKNSVIGVGSSEFAPTSSFASESEKIKATETPDKVYTEEPESFKSPVLGNTVFGEELIPSKTTKKISIDYDEDKSKKERKPRASTLPLQTKVGGEIYSADMSKKKLQEIYINKFNKKPSGTWSRPEIIDALGHPEGKLVERIKDLPKTRPKANIVMSPVKVNTTDETIPIEIKSK